MFTNEEELGMTKKLGDSDSIEPERKGKMLVSWLEKAWVTTAARDKNFFKDRSKEVTRERYNTVPVATNANYQSTLGDDVVWYTYSRSTTVSNL
jgi:hypothetical protein